MRTPPRSSVLLCALALGACGTTKIDTGKVEKKVTEIVASATQIQGLDVSCPSGLKAQKGKTFVCQAKAKDGTRQAINVKQRDDKGNVFFREPLLRTGAAQDKIAAQVLAQTKTRATVDCPDLVRITVGATFRCTARAASGEKATIVGTFTGADGAFTFKGENA